MGKIKKCKYFRSYYDDYDKDPEEPKDQGFCGLFLNDNYCDYEIMEKCAKNTAREKRIKSEQK